MRFLVTLLVNLLFVFSLVSTTRAHVTVEPRQAPAGGFVSYTFRVPSEKEVPTTSVRIEFPADLVVSRFQPKASWTREVVKDQSGRISGVSWTGGSLAADEFEEFSIVARNPRQAGNLAFRAYQGYADGSVVEWTGPAGSESPAPLVSVVEATGPVADAHGQEGGGTAPAAGGGAGATGSTGGASASGSTSVGGGAATVGSSGGTDLSLFVALGSVVMAVLALALAAVSLARRPQPA